METAAEFEDAVAKRKGEIEVKGNALIGFDKTGNVIGLFDKKLKSGLVLTKGTTTLKKLRSKVK